MSQIETVIRTSKQLEQLLEQHYGATGRGLHEKTSSVATQFNNDTIRGLRKIATLRNKVVHEDFEIEDLAEFQNDAQQLVTQLQPKSKPKTTTAQATLKTAPFTEQKPSPPNHQTSTKPPAHPRKKAVPRPQLQPRVQLPSDRSFDKNKPKKPHRAEGTISKHTDNPITAILPAISGLLIFITIIWILAH